MLTDYNFDGLDELANAITRSEGPRCHRESPDGIYRAEGVIEQMEGARTSSSKPPWKFPAATLSDLAFRPADWGGNVVYNFTFVMFTWQSEYSTRYPHTTVVSFTSTLKEAWSIAASCSGGCADADRSFMTEIIYRALSKALPIGHRQ